MQGISYLLSPAAITMIVVLFLSLLMTTCTLRHSEAYASVITSNNNQEWVDTANNIKIRFVYDLNKPTIHNLNELNFTVQNLKTGNNLKNVTANIAVVNSPDPTFKFDNVTAPKGNFSVRCPFLNDGMHQVIVNIRSNNNYAIALASFNLNVPTTNFLTYENSTFGIKIQYPSSWDEEQNGTMQDTETDIVTFYPFGSNSNASLDVTTDDISDEKGISLNQYASDSLTDLKQSLKDFKLVGSTTNSLLAGLPAYDYVYTYQDGNSSFKDMEIGAIKGDKVFILTYEAGMGEYGKYLPVIQQLINSFQITK